jgi:chromosome partitioning protein
MSFVITVALLKGGVGKTTTAVALAEAAALSVPTVLVDSDPMGSAVRWSELAEAAGRPLRAQVIGIPAADLPRRIHASGRDAGVLVIDAPPPGPGAERIAGSAVMVADIVVMPVPPQLADLDRVQATMRVATTHGKPARAVLTQVRGGVGDRAEAVGLLNSWGVPVYDTELPLTVAVQRAYGQAVTGGPLLRFGVELMTEIIKEAQG